jgi:hypothetical protein
MFSAPKMVNIWLHSLSRPFHIPEAIRRQTA